MRKIEFIYKIIRPFLFWALIFFIVLLSIYRRRGGIAPDSLWLDDVWVALLAKRGDIPFILTARFPCPPGFIFILKSIGMVFGFGSLQLQMLPLLASVLLIFLMAYVIREVTKSCSLAVIGAALLAGNFHMSFYSLRIKFFTLDGLVVLTILYLSLSSLKYEGTKRFLVLSLFSAAAVFVSFTSIYFSVFAVLFVHARLFILNRSKGKSLRKMIAESAAVYYIAAFILFIFFIRGRGTPSLHAYWRDYYIPVENLKNAAEFLSDTGLYFFGEAFIKNIEWMAIFIPIGIWQLLRDKGKRPVGYTVILFYIAIFAASSLKLYPLGGGRTDIFSYPVSIFTAIVGLWAITRKIRHAPVLIMLIILMFYLFGVNYKVFYQGNANIEMVESLDLYEKKDDPLIVFPWANYPLGYYGKWKPIFIKANGSANGFYVEIERPNTYVLPESYGGLFFVDYPEVLGTQLGFLESKPRRVLYLAASVLYADTPHRWIINNIVSHGYSLEYDREGVDGSFMIFEAQ